MRLINLLASGIRDTAGVIAANAQVYSYRAGTTTLTPLYEDFDLTDPFPNPLTLDAAGVAIAYVDRKVKLVIVDSEGATIRQIDHVGTDSSDVAAAATSVQAGAGLIVDGDGALAVNPDGATLTVVADVLKIPNDGVGAAQIDDDIVLSGDCSVTGSFTSGGNMQVGDALTDTLRIGGPAGALLQTDNGNLISPSIVWLAAITNAALKAYSARTLGVRSAGIVDYPLVVSAGAPAHGQQIVAGHVTSAPALSLGEGFSVASGGTGIRNVTFTAALATSPIVVVTPADNSIIPYVSARSTAGFTVEFRDTGGTLLNREFSFIAIGQRGS